MALSFPAAATVVDLGEGSMAKELMAAGAGWVRDAVNAAADKTDKVDAAPAADGSAVANTVVATPVPEPGTYLMFGAGLVAVALRLRRIIGRPSR